MEPLLFYKDYFSLKDLKTNNVNPLLKLDLNEPFMNIIDEFGNVSLVDHIKLINKLHYAYIDNDK